MPEQARKRTGENRTALWMGRFFDTNAMQYEKDGFGPLSWDFLLFLFLIRSHIIAHTVL